MKDELFPPGYAALFRNTGDPTLRSSEKFRKMQKGYARRSDPNTFCVAVDPRPAAKVVWSYNTEAHFGLKNFEYKNFFAAIHPFWLPIYIGMVELNHRLFEPARTEKISRDFILTANIPLRYKSNKYYWYSQVSIAGTFDSRGAMVEYLNEFHQLAEFDRMVPAMQSLTYRGVLAEGFDALMKEKVSGLFYTALKELLSPTSFKLLLAYRLLKIQSKNTSREAVAKHLGLSLQALDKGNLRLLSQARLAFPAATLTSVANFADFLNDFSGHPLPFRKMKVM